MSETVNKLQQLRDAVRAEAPMLPTENEIGKEWQPRYRRAEEYHVANSDDWDYLWGLSSAPYQSITVKDGDSTYTIRVKIDISSIFKNMVADMYYRNPDPNIQGRRTPQDTRTNRMLSDVGRALHEVAGTEDAMKKSVYNALAVSGGSIIWTSFEQHGDWVPDTSKPIMATDEASGQPMPMMGEDGQPQFEQKFAPRYERVKSEFESLWKMRFDPDGRAWDFSDHKHIFRLYHRTLQDCYDDTSWPLEFRQQLVIWTAANRQKKMTSDTRVNDETDPARIDILFAECWDRITKQIIHLPIGADAAAAPFGVAKPWPTAFAKARNGAGKFPARLVAVDWVPPDKDEKKGFYPIPLARRLRGLYEDIVRLYGLFFQSARASVRKHITIEGLLGKDDFAKIMATDADDIVTVNVEKMRQIFGANLERFVNYDQLLGPIHITDGDALKAVQYAAMIQQVWQQVYQLTGQGPGDRGGVSEAGSATEAANIRMQLDKRTADSTAEIGKAYDDITELLFLLLLEYQTLPVPYQLTTDAFAQPVWDEFQADMLTGMDLAFSHVTDSSRPRSKATDRLERKDFLATAAPFVSSKQALNKLVTWAFSVYDYPNPDELFNDPAPGIAKQAMLFLAKLQTGQINPADPNVGKMMAGLLGELADAVTTDADKEDVAMQLGGQGMGGEGNNGAAGQAGAGTGVKSSTPGQQAAGAAAAGQTNVM